MIKYQYQVIRYIHDQFTGEFGNVGIVLYAPDQNYLACRVVNRYSRLSEFFGEINGQFLLSALRQFESRIYKFGVEGAREFAALKESRELASITSSILPKDDSALQLTDVVYGLDIDPEMALSDLYIRIIERYNAEEHATRNTDQHAWSKVYKNYFDRYGITRKLKKHTVNTSKDAIDFDKAWKNGVWNCYQAVAFDLKSPDSIKSKVYKWSGIVRELETAEEKLNLYFLTTTPKNQHADLERFIRETLTVKKDTLKVTIVEEEEAERFAAQVRKDMEKSHVIEPEDEPF